MKNNKVGGNCIMFNCLKIDFCLNKFGLFILYLNLNLRSRVLRVNSFPEGSTWANLLRTLCVIGGDRGLGQKVLHPQERRR